MAEAKVIDLTESNTIPEDLTAARAAGIIGMVHQATMGSEGSDDKAEARLYLAKQAGMLRGLYHVIDDGSSVREQVKNFISAVDALDADDALLIVCKVENTEVPVDKVIEFLEDVNKELEKQPVIMASPEWLVKAQGRKLEDYPLWLVQHDSVADVPLAWGKYFLWQFTAGEVEGIGGDTGQSSFLGSDELLAKAWTGDPEATVPEGEPAPVTEEVEIQEPTMTPEGELDNAPAPDKDEEQEGDVSPEDGEAPPQASQLK
jgi:GH25 family lysozyme M1 (1,4-beta-N-acetylmuramidase)